MANSRQKMQFLMLGEGDFFSRLYYPTSFVILANGKKILAECPDMLPKMLHEATRKADIRLDIDDINHIIVTHLHGDHSNGLEGLGFYKKFHRGSKPTIYTIKEVLKDVWRFKLKASMAKFIDHNQGRKTISYGLKDYFNFRELKPGNPQSILGLKIKIRYTKHYLPCFGFKITWAGSSLGYSSDTAFDPDHIEFLSDCSVILHETNYGGHTPYEKLLTLPSWIREKMYLIHIPEDFNARASKIKVARAGKIYPV